MDAARLYQIALQLQNIAAELSQMGGVTVINSEPIENPIQKWIRLGGNLQTYQTFNPARGQHGLTEQEKQWARDAGLADQLGGIAGNSVTVASDNGTKTFIGKQPGQFVDLVFASSDTEYNIQFPKPQGGGAQFEFSVVPGEKPTDVHYLTASINGAEPVSIPLMNGYNSMMVARQAAEVNVLTLRPDAAVRIHVRYSF